MQTKFNISTPRLDNHSLFNSWLIIRFNVSWLSWAQQSISMHFTWSASQLENWSPNSQDLNAVYYFLWGRCNRWHIVTKLPTLISWPNLLLVPRTNLTSGSRYFHLAACPTSGNFLPDPVSSSRVVRGSILCDPTQLNPTVTHGQLCVQAIQPVHSGGTLKRISSKQLSTYPAADSSPSDSLLSCRLDYGISLWVIHLKCLQCFDTVGWASGRASGLWILWQHLLPP